jgi:hypothetical protein
MPDVEPHGRCFERFMRLWREDQKAAAEFLRQQIEFEPHTVGNFLRLAGYGSTQYYQEVAGVIDACLQGRAGDTPKKATTFWERLLAR